MGLARGQRLGPLHGVPVTFKDTLDTAGVRTTAGSLLFAERAPSRDATVVARLRAAGAIPLAKTNVPEFALWWETDNRVFGLTRNPWNPERTAGGSSGGEAAAIATGLSPLGIGSDLGGSIRQPAHYCGVVGLKPTHGLVPFRGHWPATLLGFNHVGPIARSVADISLALSVLAGPNRGISPSRSATRGVPRVGVLAMAPSDPSMPKCELPSKPQAKRLKVRATTSTRYRFPASTDTTGTRGRCRSTTPRPPGGTSSGSSATGGTTSIPPFAVECLRRRARPATWPRRRQPPLR